jgi:DhnA family fructose-bisphosphate aldolase class Ia
MNPPPLRLRRLREPHSGRILLLTLTHGLRAGTVPGLEDLPGGVAALADTGCPTGFVLRAGVVPSVLARTPSLRAGVVVDLYASTWLVPRLAGEVPVCSVEHAVRVGADAVLATIALGSPEEPAQLRQAGRLSHECRAWGLPLILHVSTLEKGPLQQFSPSWVGMSARMAYELEADLVVVNLCEPITELTGVLEGIDVPVLIGGGPRMRNDDELLGSVREALRCPRVVGVCLPASMVYRNGPAPVLSRLAQVLGVPRLAAPATT